MNTMKRLSATNKQPLLSACVILVLTIFTCVTCGCTTGSTAASSDASSSVSIDEATSANDTSNNKTSTNATDASGNNADSNSNTSNNSANAESSSNSTAQIQVSVVVDSSAAHSYDSKWSESLGSFSVSIAENGSVYDALKATGLRIGGTKSYVSSIGSLGEKVCGAQSGWKYSVNGTTPSTACNAYKLASGDSVCWYYALSV